MAAGRTEDLDRVEPSGNDSANRSEGLGSGLHVPGDAPAGTGGALGGLGQSITVTSNSLIILDNGVGPNTDTDLAFGSLNITAGTTLGIRGFDSLDATFTGTHNFSGTPTIDLPQAGSGSNPNTEATASVITLSGPIATVAAAAPWPANKPAAFNEPPIVTAPPGA